MSLLADLLSRVKHEEQKSDVPPHLLRIVMDSSKKRRTARRYLIVAVFGILIITIGFGTIYFVDSVLKNVVQQKIGQQAALAQKTERAAPAGSQAPSAVPPVPAEPEKPAPAPAQIVEPPPPPPPRAVQEPAASPRPQTTTVQPVTPVKEPAPVSAKPQAKPTKVIVEERSPAKEAPQAVAPRAKVLEQSRPATPQPVPQKEKKVEQVYQTSDVRPAETERVTTLFTRAQNYESQGEYRNAISLYQQILGKEPKNVTVLNKVANLYLRLKQPEEALKYSRSALDVKADYVPALINLGIAHVQQGNLREGERFLGRAVTVEPENRFGLLNLGLLYERLKDYQQAANTFHRLAQLKDLQGYLGLARIYEQQGNYREAGSIYGIVSSMADADPETRRYAQERLQALRGQR
jgi:Flp pilus assembly protein TadD